MEMDLIIYKMSSLFKVNGVYNFVVAVVFVAVLVLGLAAVA